VKEQALRQRVFDEMCANEYSLSELRVFRFGTAVVFDSRRFVFRYAYGLFQLGVCSQHWLRPVWQQANFY